MSGPRPRHEQLDGGPVPVSGQAPRPRQGPPDEGGARGARRQVQASSRATATWTATGSRSARSRASSTPPPPPTSRAAPDTTTAARYTERPDDYTTNMDRLARKFETARKRRPAPDRLDGRGSRVGRHRLRLLRLRGRGGARRSWRRKGLATDYLRLRALPFTPETCRVHRRPRPRLRRGPEPRRPDVRPAPTRAAATDAARLRSIRHYDGFPLDAETVIEGIEAGEKKLMSSTREAAATPTTPRPAAPATSTASASPSRSTAGSKSTLCVGCGHDVITRQITQALYEMSIPPYKVAKMSGIGCSSKTTAYFADRGHGFNAVHGRMPAVATGALMVNPSLVADRRLGRRRHGVDRRRPVRPPAAPQRPDGLHRREQRRLRPDQGPVLGDGRRRLEAEDRRRQRPARDRPLRDGDRARLRLRRAVLLGRHEAARRAPQGRPRAPRHGAPRRHLARASRSTTTTARRSPTSGRRTTRSRSTRSASSPTSRRSRSTTTRARRRTSRCTTARTSACASSAPTTTRPTSARPWRSARRRRRRPSS